MKATIVPGTSKTIYDCWVKPELGLNAQFGKGWDNRPIGNSFELMPLDNSLNNNTIESGRLHVVISRAGLRYGQKDPRMFSFATPKEIARVYKRINDPVTGVVPRPERIVQDVHKVVRAMGEIYKAKGAFVPGLAGGHVPGHRNTDAWLKTSDNWGGETNAKGVQY